MEDPNKCIIDDTPSWHSGREIRGAAADPYPLPPHLIRRRPGRGGVQLFGALSTTTTTTTTTPTCVGSLKSSFIPSSCIVSYSVPFPALGPLRAIASLWVGIWGPVASGCAAYCWSWRRSPGSPVARNPTTVHPARASRQGPRPRHRAPPTQFLVVVMAKRGNGEAHGSGGAIVASWSFGLSWDAVETRSDSPHLRPDFACQSSRPSRPIFVP